MLRISCQADVDADIALLVQQHPALSKVLSAVLAQMQCIPLRLREGGFAGLAHIVVAQLFSVASAKAISKRLDTLVSPLTAENFLQTAKSALLDCGLSNSKYNTLQGIAQAEVELTFSFTMLAEQTPEAALQQLCAFKGIGPWTAQVYLLFCAGHRDLFPAGDLALQKAVADALALNDKPNAQQLDEITQQWSPYRGSAARLFWAYYAVMKQREGIV